MKDVSLEKIYNDSINLNSLSPKSLMLELTNICNLKCAFCLNPKPNFRKKGMMEDALFSKIIDETPIDTKIVLCGIGEPTLHKKFDEYVKTASKKFNDIHLVTNGQFDTKIMNTILNSNIQKVTFSLDYFDKESYYSNKKGDLQVVINNIESLVNQRTSGFKPVLQINMLAEKDKEDQIKKALLYFNNILDEKDFVYSRNIKSLANQVEINNIQNHDDWLGLKNFKEELSKSIGTNKFFVENWVEFLNLDKPLSCRLTCRHPFLYTMVLYDGRATFCCIDFNGTMISGDLNNQTIEQLWAGDIALKFREDMINLKFEDKPLCGNCEEWYKQK